MKPEKVVGDGDGVDDAAVEADLVGEGLIVPEGDIAGVEVCFTLADAVEESGGLTTCTGELEELTTVVALLGEGELAIGDETTDACETGLQAINEAKIADIIMNFQSLFKAPSLFNGS